MKTLLAFVLLLNTTCIFSQKHPFIRVFTSINGKEGETIRGKIISISDSSITIEGKTISYHDIYTIKTKRSFGHSLWAYSLGSLFFGVTVGAIAETSIKKNNTSNNNESGSSSSCSCVTHTGLALGLLTGFSSVAGLATGTTIGVTKNATKMDVYNNLEQWQIAKATLIEKMK